MPNITHLTQDGGPPDRFVALSSPRLPVPTVWAIDGHDARRPQGLNYLAQIRSAFAGMGPLDMVLAKRVLQHAGEGSHQPDLAYMAVLALTELKGGRSVVIETYPESGIAMTVLRDSDYEGALAELDRLGFEWNPAPGMR